MLYFASPFWWFSQSITPGLGLLTTYRSHTAPPVAQCTRPTPCERRSRRWGNLSLLCCLTAFLRLELCRKREECASPASSLLRLGERTGSSNRTDPKWGKKRTWNVERVVLFLQERVTVEFNHLLGDAVRTQEVSDSLGDKNDDLTGDWLHTNQETGVYSPWSGGCMSEPP